MINLSANTSIMQMERIYPHKNIRKITRCRAPAGDLFNANNSREVSA